MATASAVEDVASTDDGVVGRAALACALLVLGVGLLEMLAWLLRWAAPLRLHTTYPPMVFTTALAVALTGLAITLAVLGRVRWARAAGAGPALLGMVSLAEHALGRDFGVDQLVVDAWLAQPGSPPGLMAVNSATWFVVAGTALAAWQPGSSHAEADALDRARVTFQFLGPIPVGVAILTPGGERDLMDFYRTLVAGTDDLYPVDRLSSVQALVGRSSRIDDLEIERPRGHIPLEVWGTPVPGDAGDVRFAIPVGTDMTGRRAAGRTRAEQAALLDLAPDAIYIRGADRRITYWNRGAEDYFGWTSEEALGQVSAELLATALPLPLPEIEAVLARDGYWEGELVQHSRSGDRRMVACRLVGQVDRCGTLRRVMAINTVVTAQREAQEELALRSAALERANLELQRSNEELEQFAYIASHDLSEPLRAISGPMSLLSRRYSGRLDEDADRFIQFAVDGCERMQTLIDDLLAYSRVGRKDAGVTAVDTAALVVRLLDETQARTDPPRACLTRDDLPVVTAHATQLGQVFQNLLANAVKFTAPEVLPQVHVGCDRDGDLWRFSVTDNGIGIDARHRERVFGMFQRLHGRDVYPGTGIGLALCRKIVEGHGGTIEVGDGPDGAGSTFTFTIPVHPVQRP